MEQVPGEQQDLRSLIEALWRRRWLFLAFAITIPVAVYVISTQVPKTYEATTLLRLKTTNINSSLVTGAASFGASAIDTAERLIHTPEVAEQAAREVGKDEGSLNGDVSATPIVASSGALTDLLSLTARDESPNRAAAVANAYARAVVTLRTKDAIREIDAAIAQLNTQFGSSPDEVAQLDLERQLQELRTVRLAQEDSTEIVQPATAPGTPISPHPRRNAALAGLVGVLLGLAAVALAERLDRRLRDAADLERLLGAPLLSVIPRSAFPGEQPARTAVAEAFRTLAASLLYFNVDQRLRTVMVVSPTKGDGKTTVATHLAIALARDGQDVVLVDCDLRRPQVAVRLGIEPPAGLSAVVTSQADLRDALVEVDVGGGRLHVLAGGQPPPNPALLLGSARLDSLLAELSEGADIVVLDTPPMLHVSDAVPLLKRVSGSIVVARIDYTSRDALGRMRQVIETAQGTVLGAVATGATAAGLYGYGSGYYEEYGEVTQPSVNGPTPQRPAGKRLQPARERTAGKRVKREAAPTATPSAEQEETGEQLVAQLEATERRIKKAESRARAAEERAMAALEQIPEGEEEPQRRRPR